MIDLQKYVDGLFRHQRLTPEVKDLKEEILSNMIAKRDDLIAQGLSAEKATEEISLPMLANIIWNVCKHYCSTVLFFGFFPCRFSLPIMR